MCRKSCYYELASIIIRLTLGWNLGGETHTLFAVNMRYKLKNCHRQQTNRYCQFTTAPKHANSSLKWMAVRHFSDTGIYTHINKTMIVRVLER
jgi:hypothetical protein